MEFRQDTNLENSYNILDISKKFSYDDNLKVEIYEDRKPRDYIKKPQNLAKHDIFINSTISLEEINKLIRADDIRVKPIILSMISSGIKLNAWDSLKWKHVIPIIDGNANIIAAKLLVYEGENGEYYTFITSEAYTALKNWMEFRIFHGEKITGESWIMRDMWKMIDRNKRGNLGYAKNPKQLKSNSVSTLLGRTLFNECVNYKRGKDRRKEYFKISSIFRKLFKTSCKKTGIKSINMNLLLGSKFYISSLDLKPTPEEIFEDYLKIKNLLTLNEENEVLRSKHVV